MQTRPTLRTCRPAVAARRLCVRRATSPPVKGGGKEASPWPNADDAAVPSAPTANPFSTDEEDRGKKDGSGRVSTTQWMNLVRTG